MGQDNKNNERIDLRDGLKDFSTGVKFQDEWPRPRYEQEMPKIIQWTIKYSGGYIKDEKQASSVLMGFAALAIVISLFLFFGSGDTRPPVSPDDLHLTPPSRTVLP